MDQTQTTITDAPRAVSRLRGVLWDGVLPEGLGLCFVAIILGGFAGAYVAGSYAAQRAVQRETQVIASQLATRVAGTLANLSDAETPDVERHLSLVGGVPNLRDVRWLAADGMLRGAWSPANGAASTTPATHKLCRATAPVQAPDGTALGEVRLALVARPSNALHASLLWNWGMTAGVTLLLFIALYHRLRKHLRPMSAIDRNLRTLATDAEHELNTLMLSASLGQVATGWNTLVEQLNDLRRQIERTEHTIASSDVLARFEGAVFRRVVDRLPFGVMCIDDEARVSYVNDAATALMRKQRDTLLHSSVEDALDEPAVTQALLGVRARGGGGMIVDQTQGEREHETTLRYRVLPLAEQPGSHMALITLEDIGVLRESQRARDNFLYHVTHELRTPLTNIHAYAETLTKPDFDDEQTRKECYNVIVSETRRLSRLVEDILSISQLEVGSARLDAGQVDVQRLLRQTVQDNLGAADEKRIDLTLSLPPKLPKMSGDKQRLAVLFNNLIGNALKYTPQNGEVHVGVTIEDSSLQISVADTGIGIAPEDQEHIFEKFYRASNDAVQMVTGTGLGLALAREVARLHGGDIRLESELGEGSTFTIDLPLPNTELVEGTGQ